MPSPDTAEKKKLSRRLGVDNFLTFMRVVMSTFVILGLLMFIGQQINPDNFVASRINPDATGLTAAQFEGLVISGLSQGAMYGLIALGYSMVYGVLGFINFAHGEVFMVGAMTGMITSNKLDESGAWESNFLLSLLFVVVIAIICSTLTAVIMERVAYRPLRGSPRLIPLITSIGVSFFIQNVSVVLLGPGAKSYPTLPDWLSRKREPFGLVSIEGTKLMVLLTAAVSMVALWYLVERTKIGKAMRAVAEDKEIASLMGINVNRTIVSTFAVGGAMAGVAGILWGDLAVSLAREVVPGADQTELVPHAFHEPPGRAFLALHARRAVEVASGHHGEVEVVRRRLAGRHRLPRHLVVGRMGPDPDEHERFGGLDDHGHDRRV